MTENEKITPNPETEEQQEARELAEEEARAEEERKELAEDNPGLKALCDYLDADILHASERHGEWYIDGGYYRILSDAEAEHQARESVLDLLEEESGKTTLWRLCSQHVLNEIADDVINADGRGHILSGYDGEEIYLGDDLFAYRTN